MIFDFVAFGGLGGTKGCQNSVEQFSQLFPGAIGTIAPLSNSKSLLDSALAWLVKLPTPIAFAQGVPPGTVQKISEHLQPIALAFFWMELRSKQIAASNRRTKRLAVVGPQPR